MRGHSGDGTGPPGLRIPSRVIERRARRVRRAWFFRGTRTRRLLAAVGCKSPEASLDPLVEWAVIDQARAAMMEELRETEGRIGDSEQRRSCPPRGASQGRLDLPRLRACGRAGPAAIRRARRTLSLPSAHCPMVQSPVLRGSAHRPDRCGRDALRLVHPPKRSATRGRCRVGLARDLRREIMSRALMSVPALHRRQCGSSEMR